MNSLNFASIGKMDENIFIMKQDSDYKKKKIDENKWFEGNYNAKDSDNFSQKTMECHRKLESKEDEQIKALFTNERVRNLESFILEHEEAKGVDVADLKLDDEDDEDSDDERSLQRISNQNNKNKENKKRNKKGSRATIRMRKEVMFVRKDQH